MTVMNIPPPAITPYKIGSLPVIIGIMQPMPIAVYVIFAMS